MSSGYPGRLIFTRKVTHFLKYHWPVPRNKSTKVFFYLRCVSVGPVVWSLLYYLYDYLR